MTKIDRIELYHVAVPLSSPFYPAWIPGYPQTESRFTLLKLTTGDGVTGWAAGNAFADERQGLGSLLGPYLIGMDPTDIPRVRQLLREASFLGWHNPWIEAACWDIKGKIEGLPVYRLLNPALPGPVTEARVYASSGSLKPSEERRAYLESIRAMGFDAVKLRVHDFDPGRDIETVATARAHLGDGFTIGVDANQGWRVTLIDDAPLWDLERATDFGLACQDHGVRWLEEPLDMHDADGLAELRRRMTTLKIAGCELNAGWHEARLMLEKGSLDVYQPDATFCGGLATSMMIADACLERGLEFTPHTWTNGVGFVVNLHAFAAFPARVRLEYPYEPPGWVPEVRDAILAEPLAVRPDGTVAVPQTPGLGLEIDPRRLRRYGTRFFTMTPRRLALHTIRTKGLKTALELKRRRAARAGG
ncbi:MAG: mandelate racemase/muconate lactonizing enzyme family protein [Thermoanaerobaculales bacterium]|jgi:L-alanine-DL-glutamate epimerase-like enolase superfamily enzyme|nr:mandelate racemase/muconate lactonizing enzyme family protein [Thermoanaerobaculales bacterium]